MLPEVQEISFDDCETASWSSRNGGDAGGLPSSTTSEGESENPDSGSSTSYNSETGESGATFKSCHSSHHNLSSHCSFLSKATHPLYFPGQTPRESPHSAAIECTGFDVSAPQIDTRHWSSGYRTDLLDVSEPIGDHFGRSYISIDGCKCGLCEKFLSQRSPWGARRIVRSGDMPVASVLSCCHVFHAECLEQTTPKAHKMDPPCPLCARMEYVCFPDQTFQRFRNDPSRSRYLSEDESSRPWGCAPNRGFVEETLHAHPHNAAFLLNSHRSKRNLSPIGHYARELPGRLKNTRQRYSALSGENPVDLSVVGCSETMSGPSLKR